MKPSLDAAWRSSRYSVTTSPLAFGAKRSAGEKSTRGRPNESVDERAVIVTAPVLRAHGLFHSVAPYDVDAGSHTVPAGSFSLWAPITIVTEVDGYTVTRTVVPEVPVEVPVEVLVEVPVEVLVDVLVVTLVLLVPVLLEVTLVVLWLALVASGRVASPVGASMSPHAARAAAASAAEAPRRRRAIAIVGAGVVEVGMGSSVWGRADAYRGRCSLW